MVQAFLSRDGTAIAYERDGHGPALVVVNGALSDRSSSRSLVPVLESSFTVYRYDRRGRGMSGEASAWSMEREIEDLDGLLEIIGEPVLLYGQSSGAMLALEATLRGLEVERLALDEPPFILPATRPLPPPDLPQQLAELVADGDLPAATLAFYRDVVGISIAALELVTSNAGWEGVQALAHTVPYDAAIVGLGVIPYRRLAIETPVLVLTGAASSSWLRTSNKALAEALPRGRHVLLAAPEHAAASKLVAAELTRFFGESVLVGAA